MIGRRRFLTLTGAGLAAPFVLRDDAARAQEFSLRLHHPLPAASTMHEGFLEPWADSVAEASDDRLAIQIFPAMQLGGTSPQLYDQARDGGVDIVLTPASATPGRFPRLEVFELPFIAARRGVANAQAIQEFAAKHTEEFAEVQPLVVWGEDHGVVHAKKQIAAAAAMKGARLCAPTRLCGEALQALGATAVSMPAPLIQEGLAQNVIDGCVLAWDSVPATNLEGLTPFHTEIPGSPTLATTVYLLVMNKARFGALPDDLRAVLMDKSGQNGALLAGQAFDAKAEEVAAMVKERGNTSVQLAAEEKARWIEAVKPVAAKWVEDSRARGIDGDALIAEARTLIAKYDKPS